MQTFLLAAVLIVFGLAFRSRAATPATNPADLDREVIEKLSVKDDLFKESDSVDSIPLDAKLAAFLDERRPVLELMRQAALLPHADWGTFDGEVLKVMPSLNGARRAVILTWLAARYDAAQGRPDDAVQELLSGIALARHLGQQPLLICELVEMGCESGSIDHLAALLPGLSNDLAGGLAARFDALPKAAGLAAVIDGERQLGRVMVLKQLAQPLPANAPPGAAQRVEAFRAMADRVGPFYDAAKAAAGGSPQEFKDAIHAAAAKMPDNVMVKIVAPTFEAVRDPSAAVEAKWAMLRTAAEITAKGPTALAESKDPFGDGPFTRVDTADGYTLSSRLRERDQPVTLQVGP